MISEPLCLPAVSEIFIRLEPVDLILTFITIVHVNWFIHQAPAIETV